MEFPIRDASGWSMGWVLQVVFGRMEGGEGFEGFEGLEGLGFRASGYGLGF